MKDISNYDYLSVSVKTDIEEEMVSRYEKFGWEKIQRTDHKRFSDIAEITFRRAHKIPDKDRLQYLQVRMETAVNNLAKCGRDKHAGSVCFGLSFGLFGGALVAGGIVLLALLSALWPFVAGAGLILAGIGVLTATAVTLTRLVPKENARFDRLSLETQKELRSIDAEAAALTEADYGG